jgi:D-beta-D-heptose 7-phosphate kinase/D-beta-D-heptose 1-phosphate adenosyltransferase
MRMIPPPGNDMGTVVSIQRLLKIRESAREQGKRVVFTNGCFDILHRGHIELLRQARGLGDILIVALNSDRSVARIKGERRPIVAQEDRAEILAALACVDYVVLFEEDTPERVIAALRPDVLVKGSDYAVEDIVGRRQVEESGGKVVRVPLHGEFSTEKMLRDIAFRYRAVAGDDS